MSEFMGLTKNLIWEKWKLMNWVAGISILIVAVLQIMNLINTATFGRQDLYVEYTIVAIIASFVSIILLARRNERVYTSNNYRLLPVTGTKLFFSNLLTTVIAFIYLWLINSIIGGVAFGISNQKLMSMNPGMGTTTAQDIGLAVSFLLLSFLAIIMVWSGITLVHFVINLVSDLLPFGRQKFILFLIYLVVIWLSLVIFNFTTGNIFRLIYSNNLESLKQLYGVIGTSSAVFGIWFVVFTVLDIYLLNRWVETNH